MSLRLETASDILYSCCCCFEWEKSYLLVNWKNYVCSKQWLFVCGSHNYSQYDATMSGSCVPRIASEMVENWIEFVDFHLKFCTQLTGLILNLKEVRVASHTFACLLTHRQSANVIAFYFQMRRKWIYRSTLLSSKNTNLLFNSDSLAQVVCLNNCQFLRGVFRIHILINFAVAWNERNHFFALLFRRLPHLFLFHPLCFAFVCDGIRQSAVGSTRCEQRRPSLRRAFDAKTNDYARERSR